MAYEMQIRVSYTGARIMKARVSWKTLKPKYGYGGNPYRWATEEKAQRMLDIAYPHLAPENKRVVEVDAKVNIGNEKDVRGMGGLTVPLFGWERA